MTAKRIPYEHPTKFNHSSSEDPRLGHLIKPWSESSTSPGWVIIGHPDDEGIQANFGRPGAAKAPQCIRRFLYHMTSDWLAENSPQIFDAGDFDCSNSTIEARHTQALNWLEQRHRQGFKVVSLGGGHDYGYPDCAAFVKAHADSKKKPLVVHFDAHFDVRPFDKGINSGTPFRRLFELEKNFELIAIGMQPNCNSRAHADWLRERALSVLTASEILLSGETEENVMLRSLAPHLEQSRPIFVSLDIDVIRHSEAPGCSQSWPLGLSAKSVAIVLEVLSRRASLNGMGIYEVSPALDVSDQTSRLAAQYLHRLVSSSADGNSAK